MYILEGQYYMPFDLEGIMSDVIVAEISTGPDERTHSAK
jgi:hypothetical protein